MSHESNGPDRQCKVRAECSKMPVPVGLAEYSLSAIEMAMALALHPDAGHYDPEQRDL